MRLYLRDRPPGLAHGLLSLLLDAYDAEPDAVYLISPWVRDVALPAGEVGHFATVFGGHRETLPLSDLVERLATRHRVHIVTKPPHELVDLPLVRRLLNTLDVRQEVLDEEELEGRAVRDAVVADLNDSIEYLARRVATHAPTVELGLALRDRGARLHYLDRLHAKLVVTPVGGLIGSANLTRSGLHLSEESVLEVADPKTHDALAAAAEELVARAVPAEAYNVGPHLRGAYLSDDDLRTLAEHPALARHDALRQLSTRVLRTRTS